jgi:hypothetical protein
LGHGRAVWCDRRKGRRADGRTIQYEIFAFLVQDRETVQSECAAEELDWRVRLFDNAKQGLRIGGRHGARSGAAAQFLEEEFYLARQIVGALKRIRHRMGSEIRQDKTVLTFALQEHAFEIVLAEIDPDD